VIRIVNASVGQQWIWNLLAILNQAVFGFWWETRGEPDQLNVIERIEKKKKVLLSRGLRRRNDVRQAVVLVS
jgi:hypothetical protein